MIVLTEEEVEVAETIKGLMDKDDISLRSLEKLSGVSFATIHDFLSGRSSPKLITIIRLAAALDVEARDLLPLRRKRKKAS